MMTALTYLAISLVVALFALTFSVLIRYLSRRGEVAPELVRMRFGLKAFFNASLPPVSDGANMRTTEGFVATTTNGKLDSIRKTRTISREL
jgi:hypothetical protein